MLSLKRFIQLRKAFTIISKSKAKWKSRLVFPVGRSFTRINAIYGYRSAYSFSTTPEKDNDNNDIFNEFDEEATDREKVVKNLSLKLIESDSSDSVLSIFENEYLKSAKKEIFGEELCLLLYFTVKHNGDITQDMRLTTLLDMLFTRFEGMAFDFILTTIWSLGILVSMRGAEIPIEHKLKILNEILKSDIPKHSVQNLPSLIFSISCFIGPEQVTDEVIEAVKKIWDFYIKEGILTLDPLQMSTILTGLSRLQYHNSEYLLTLSKAMKMDRFFFEWNERDLMSIIVALADLHYKEDNLFQVLHKEVINNLDNITPYSLFLIIQSYARIIPEKNQYYFDLYHKLIETLEKHPDELTVDLYVNQMLSLACYKGKSSDIRVSKLASAYCQLMNKQDRFTFNDFTGSDACNLLVAIVALDIKSIKYIKKVVEVIQANMSMLTTIDLINLSKSAFSLSKEDFPDLYTKVHSAWVQRLTSFEPWERKILEETYTMQGTIKDSPFIKKEAA